MYIKLRYLTHSAAKKAYSRFAEQEIMCTISYDEIIFHFHHPERGWLIVTQAYDELKLKISERLLRSIYIEPLGQ